MVAAAVVVVAEMVEKYIEINIKTIMETMVEITIETIVETIVEIVNESGKVDVRRERNRSSLKTANALMNNKIE